MSIQSVWVCRSSGLSFPLPMCLYGMRRAPFHFCLLASSMMSCRHRIRFRSCLPSRDTRPVICLSCGLVPLLTALSFAPSLVSYRLASPPAPSLVSSSGAMSCCGLCRLALLVRAMWYRVGGGAAACFVMSAMSMRCVDSGGVGPSS